MRTIKFSKGSYRGEIRTSDLYTPAYGNNYLDIAFVQESQTIPSNVTIEVEGKSFSFTLPVRFSRLATSQLDGCFFSLEWFRHYAPQHGTQAVDLTIYADNTIVASLKYYLTAKRGEVLLNPKTIVMLDENENAEEYDHTIILDECYNVASTQFTEHWNELEMMVYSGSEFSITSVGIGGWGRPISQGFTSLTKSSDLFFEIQGTTILDHATIERFEFTENYCHDIEIRITDRNGLRGVMGGKIIDSSEGGDDVKSNFDKVTPYAGIFRHNKSGQKIQKEVFFDCGGDTRLLGLLRDACVYGVAEWYDERTAQWLPCEVADNSLDTDPFKEQSITFILQQL